MAAAPARSSRRAPTSRSPSQAPQPAETAGPGGAHAPTQPNRARAARPGSARARSASPSEPLLLPKHRVLQTLGEPELHHALRRDLDRLAGLRIATHARLAVREHEAPASREDEDVLDRERGGEG